MRYWPIIVAALAALIAPPTAGAGALIAPDLWKYQTWMDTSLAPAPPGRIVFTIEDCAQGMPGVSCALERDGLPDTIHLSPDAADDRSVFLHEVGHVFDFQVLKPRHRRLFTRWIGRAGTGWEDGKPRTFELFAAAYADCATGESNGQYGWGPPAWLQARICWLIDRAA